jgi:hypothetical protein
MHCLKRFLLIFAVALSALMTIPWIAAATADEPPATIEQTFQRAKKDYLDKNINSASEQIRKGAAYMKEKAAKASAKGKGELEESARELDKLADDVKKGTVKSVKRIEDAFARAYHALALESHIESTESWAKRERARAGEALEAANKNLERGISWAGQKVEASTKKVMKKSEEISQKLKRKGRLITEEVGKGIQDAGKEIEKFGKKISPRDEAQTKTAL